jgi:FKBP-type peptidyl-prolyl cis-trans isomerase
MTSCREVPVIDVQKSKGDTLKENMINANRIIAESEETQIDAYVSRRGWQMERLSCGARVMETHRGSGAAIGYEDTVAVSYSVEALNGTLVYDHRRDTVVAGHLKPTRGFDAALRTLHRGSTARIILPSEQAYGVVGDGERISTRMVLVYNVEVDARP